MLDTHVIQTILISLGTAVIAFLFSRKDGVLVKIFGNFFSSQTRDREENISLRNALNEMSSKVSDLRVELTQTKALIELLLSYVDEKNPNLPSDVVDKVREILHKPRIN